MCPQIWTLVDFALALRTPTWPWLADNSTISKTRNQLLFKDMSGLLDAVADHGFATHLNEKNLRKPGDDPVEDLRRMAFACRFRTFQSSDLQADVLRSTPGVKSPAATNSYRILRKHIQRI